MKALTKLTALGFVVGFYVGCSPVKFSVSSENCSTASSCVVENGKLAYNYSVTAGAGKVDILIVDDNSASMSFEQKRLAPRFANFIQNMDAKKVDYRIAITTTDVSGGKFPQGGKLIQMGDGSYFLTPSSGGSQSTRVSYFGNALQRPETASCESFIGNYVAQHGINSINSSAYSSAYSQNCPSGDERGIYSANLVVRNNPNSFIRSDAHLAVIFLSDEDERSGLYSSGNYLLSELDQPSSLPKSVKSSFGNAKYNSMSVHAIVVKDQACLNEQNNQVLAGVEATRGLVTGSVGSAYLAFTNVSPAWGVAANICSSDYTGQLGQIQTNIENHIKDIMLKCENPTDLQVSLTGGSVVAHSVNGKVLTFSQYLSPGTTVNLSYKCSGT